MPEHRFPDRDVSQAPLKVRASNTLASNSHRDIGPRFRSSKGFAPYVRLHLIAQCFFAMSWLPLAIFGGKVFLYLQYMGLFCIGVTGWLCWFLSRQRIGLLWSLTAVYFGLLFQGLLRDNWLTFWGVDAIFFLPVFAIGAGLCQGFVSRFVVAYGRLFTIMVPFAAVAIGLGMRPSTSGERLEGAFASFVTLSVVMPSLYLIFFDKSLKVWSRWSAYFGLALVAMFGLVTQTRGAVLLPIQVIALYLVLQRGRSMSTLLRVIVVSVLIVATAISLWSSGELERSGEGLVKRFQSKDRASGRNEEASAVIEQLKGVDFAFGRGFGGTYNYDIRHTTDRPVHGRFMVHYAYAHLMLKGGGALLSFLLFVLLSALYMGVRHRRQHARAGLGVLLVFVALNIAHTQFTGSVMTPVAFVMIGYLILGQKGGFRKCPS